MPLGSTFQKWVRVERLKKTESNLFLMPFFSSSAYYFFSLSFFFLFFYFFSILFCCFILFHSLLQLAIHDTEWRHWFRHPPRLFHERGEPEWYGGICWTLSFLLFRLNTWTQLLLTLLSPNSSFETYSTPLKKLNHRCFLWSNLEKKSWDWLGRNI